MKKKHTKSYFFGEYRYKTIPNKSYYPCSEKDIIGVSGTRYITRDTIKKIEKIVSKSKTKINHIGYIADDFVENISNKELKLLKTNLIDLIAMKKYKSVDAIKAIIKANDGGWGEVKLYRYLQPYHKPIYQGFIGIHDKYLYVVYDRWGRESETFDLDI